MKRKAPSQPPAQGLTKQELLERLRERKQDLEQAGRKEEANAIKVGKRQTRDELVKACFSLDLINEAEGGSRIHRPHKAPKMAAAEREQLRQRVPKDRQPLCATRTSLDAVLAKTDEAEECKKAINDAVVHMHELAVLATHLVVYWALENLDAFEELFGEAVYVAAYEACSKEGVHHEANPSSEKAAKWRPCAPK